MDRIILLDKNLKQLCQLHPELVIDPQTIEDANTHEHQLFFSYPLYAHEKIFEPGSYENWPEDGQCIVIPDADGDLQPYLVDDSDVSAAAEDIRSVKCNHLYFELGDGPIRNYILVNAVPSTVISAALVGTPWQLGYISPSLTAITENFYDYYLNPLQFLRIIELKYKARLKFRVEFDSHGHVTRYVDLLEIDDEFKGQRFEFGWNLHGININVTRKGLKTALVGVAIGEEIDPATDEPLPLTFKNFEWSVANGDPVNKPLGQDWVGCEDARELYGIADNEEGMLHRYGLHESQAETEEDLLLDTWHEVGDQSRPRFTVDASVTDLEQIQLVDILTDAPAQLSHEKIRLHNVCYIIARKKDLIAALDAKIIRIHRYLKDPGSTQVTFGDHIPLGSDYVRRLKRDITYKDKRRRELDRGRGPATVTIASEDTSRAPWYANIIVPAGAQNFQSYFTQAVSLLPDEGGRVVVLEGEYVYEGNINIPKNKIKVSGQGEGTKLKLKNNINASVSGIVAFQKTGIEITDISMDSNKGNQVSGDTYCVALVECSDFRVNNVKAENSTLSGIALFESGNGEVQDNYCAHNERHGISVQGSAVDVLLSANRCLNNGRTGISLVAQVGQSIISAIISDNIVKGNNRYGIYSERMMDSSVSGNTCKQSGVETGYAGIGLYLSHDNTIDGNISNKNGYQGIILIDSDDNIVNGNTCNESVYASGINVLNSDHNIVTDNICKENNLRGIAVQGNYNEIQTNKCRDNGDYGITVFSGATQNLVTNNDLYGNAAGGLQDVGTDTVTDAGNRS
ncbi:phage tail spike protein [Candidatus Contubernalis alkaliaceticus]|uniref:phage tail spike protein n=1 Tax=Candidatus Contubernalis alkaliaceticus TaxID=338645 RepID=UPI001F4C329C|nr:phage tail spike protein [Candidatus Contubernalis alkalaceticus]UNC91704.1 right-handed parallel beta-helix repeat-containing protein [Candidatus Contubernalis alkalaceticus]